VTILAKKELSKHLKYMPILLVMDVKQFLSKELDTDAASALILISVRNVKLRNLILILSLR